MSDCEVKKPATALESAAEVHPADTEGEQLIASLLAAGHNLMSAIVEAAGTLVVIVDLEGRIIAFNRACGRTTGYSLSEVRGRVLWESLLVPEERDSIRSLLGVLRSGDTPSRYDCRWLTKDGRRRLISWSVVALANAHGKTEYVICTGIDVTERHEAEEALRQKKEELLRVNRRLHENQSQLIQSEKMAAIGQLAAGVAHEINNPVGYVMSNLATLTDYVATFKDLFQHYQKLTDALRTGDPQEQPELLAQIERLIEEADVPYLLADVGPLLEQCSDGVHRVKEIVQGLKSFARADESQLQLADVNEGVETVLRMIWNELKYKCEVDKHLGRLPPIRCYPGQLNQVFMNLLVNAVQAIPEHGKITIETGVEEGHVFVRISDTGHGIPEKDLSKIFGPFFTTKQGGAGTGLGLSISLGIVHKHGGTIDVESEAGKGSTFTVRLPLGGPAEDTGGTSLARSTAEGDA